MKNTILLAIDGMHCAACSARIERVLSQQEGIEQVSVSLASHTGKVTYGEGQDRNKLLQNIIDSIHTLGFSAREMVPASAVIHLAIDGMHCAACSARIEKVLSGKEGIADVSVNLGSRTGQVRLAAGTAAGDIVPGILGTIASLGFSAYVLESQSDDFLSDTAGRWKEREEAQLEELAARRRDLVPAFLFALPLLVLSMGEMAGMPLPSFIDPALNPSHFAITQLLLCLPVIWSGRRFYIHGFPALWRKSPTMDTLVAMGTGAAFLYSLWNTIVLTLPMEIQHSAAFTPLTAQKSFGPVWDMLLGTGHAVHGVELYYESAAVVIALVSLGKYLESRSTMRTSEAMKGLLNLAPETALRLPALSSDEPDMTRGEEIPLSKVERGDILLVRPGGRVPVDGLVVFGDSLVDESMLTGESMPVAKTVGDSLAAGTMNQNGRLVLKAEKVGADTVLARIVQLVQDAQSSKAPIAAIADRVSLYFVPAVIAVAVIAGLFWWQYSGSTAFALRIMVSVLVIACPCAMGLATPISIMAGTGRGAQLGLLFKNGQALESMSKVSTVVFDKTGTLTEGRPAVTDIVLLPEARVLGLNDETVIRLAASLESLSEHALARAVVDKAQAVVPDKPLLTVTDFVAIPGKGVQGKVSLDGSPLVIGIGNRAFAEEQHSDESLEGSLLPFAMQGKTPVIFTVAGKACAILALADQLREEAPRVIGALAGQSIESIMLTGDAEVSARSVAGKAGIERVHAGVLPAGKEQIIAQLVSQGKTVAMVGDGINDAPALARADVGIAMGSGIDVAVETGDVVLMRPGLSSILEAFSLSKATMRNIRQNLFWAFAFNVVGIPFAAGVFYLWGGPVLSPMLAGSAMAMSSVTVVTNALRLRFFKPQKV